MNPGRLNVLFGATLLVLLPAALTPRGAAQRASDRAPDGAPVPIDERAAEPEADDRRGEPEAASLEAEFDDGAFGRSGALRTLVALPGERLEVPLRWREPRPRVVRYRWRPVLGTPAADARPAALRTAGPVTAPARPGVYELELESADGVLRMSELRLLVLTPFERKRRGYLNGYHIGRYPTEGSGRTDRYAPPAGFIEVTAANRDLRLSDHFTLKEFLTHDQANVWPKYAVVNRLLLDKLELVLADLNDNGVRAHGMVVMSGFRTPQYNRRGLGAGRARLSRHQFGDAADVWVDNDGDWYMDDLNGDGRRNTRDARVMLAAVERVERHYPSLAGGAGVYADNGAHGPFIHIDARGRRARW